MLLSIGSTGLYSCKKNVTETDDPNGKFSNELKTYHSSEDYKKLLRRYPDGEFIDLPISDANSRLKVIITIITNSSNQIVKAMTYFEPKDKVNNWYPTIVVNLESVNESIDLMLKNENFTGSVELSLADDTKFDVVRIVNNKDIYRERYIRDLNGTVVKEMKVSGHTRIMYAEAPGDLKKCLIAANECAAEDINSMGWISYVACVATFTTCLFITYADCFISEPACFGVPKPIREV